MGGVNMWNLNLVIGGLIVGTAAHVIIAFMAAINFMWWTTALAGVASFVGFYFIDQLETLKREEW